MGTKQTETVLVKIPKFMYAHVRNLALKKGVTVSELIAVSIAESLTRENYKAWRYDHHSSISTELN